MYSVPNPSLGDDEVGLEHPDDEVGVELLDADLEDADGSVGGWPTLSQGPSQFISTILSGEHSRSEYLPPSCLRYLSMTSCTFAFMAGRSARVVTSVTRAASPSAEMLL